MPRDPQPTAMRSPGLMRLAIARVEPLSAHFAGDVSDRRLRGDLANVVEVGQLDHADHRVGRVVVIFGARGVLGNGRIPVNEPEA